MTPTTRASTASARAGHVSFGYPLALSWTQTKDYFFFVKRKTKSSLPRSRCETSSKLLMSVAANPGGGVLGRKKFNENLTFGLISQNSWRIFKSYDTVEFFKLL